jgi:hypothetical protein
VPHRTVNVVLTAMGLAGLLLIAALAIWGSDIRRASRSGPMWKRKLLTAGLLLLAMMGVNSCADAPIDKSPDSSATLTDADQRKQLIANAWRDLDAAWSHGADYAFGRHGFWPFDKAAKTASLKQTEQFDVHVAVLERFGALKGIEADALRLEWDFIQEEIEFLPAADLRKGYPKSNACRRADIKAAGELLGHLGALIKARTVRQPVVGMIHHDTLRLVRNLRRTNGHTSHRLNLQARGIAEELFDAGLKLESRTIAKGDKLEKHAAWKHIQGIIRFDNYFLGGSRLDVKDGVIGPDKDDGDYSKLKERKKLRRLVAWASGQFDGMLKQGVLDPAEANTLRSMLPTVKSEDQINAAKQSGDLKPVEWVNLIWALSGRKSMLRPLHPVLLSAMEARVNMAVGRGLGLCLVHPRMYGPDTGGYSLADRKQMRTALRAVKEMPLLDSSKLLENTDWKKIAKAHQEASALGERVWIISSLDRRRIEELFEPLDKSILSLAASGLLVETEAEMLRGHRRFMLQVARDRENRFPESVIQAAVCNRLSRRADLLGKLAMLDRPDWRIADYVLPAVEGDMAVLDYLEKDFKRGGEPSEFDSGLGDESPLEKELKTWTDSKGRTYRAEDFDDMGRHKSTIDKIIAIREAAGAVVKKIRAKQTVDRKDLAQTHQWRTLTETWRDAQAMSGWSPEAYTSSRFGAQRLRGRLTDALWDIESLRRAELLSDAEAGLLRSDLELFIDASDHRLPLEEPRFICYGSGTPRFPLYTERWTALQKRVVLLEKLADSPQIKPEVIAKVIYSLKKDVELPSLWRQGKKLTPVEKKQIDQTRKTARKLIDKIRKRLRPDDSALSGSDKWLRIVQAFSHAHRAVRTGTDFQGRMAIQAKLDQALLDAYLLYAQGMLTRKESLVVETEIANANHRLVYCPPTDFANGIYMNALAGVYVGHRCDEVISRVYPYKLKEMLPRKAPGREVLEIMARSLETDIWILKNRRLPYCCAEHDPEEFVEQTDKVKAILAEIRLAIADGK